MLSVVPSSIAVLRQARVYRLADSSQRQRLGVSCTRDPIVPIIETPQAVVVLPTPVRAASKNGRAATSMIIAGSAPLFIRVISASNNPVTTPPKRRGRQYKRWRNEIMAHTS